jgi:hypothetical protein
MKEYTFTYNQRAKNFGYSFEELQMIDCEPESESFCIYDAVKSKKRINPPGMSGIYDSTGRNIIDDPIEFDLVYNRESHFADGGPIIGLRTNSRDGVPIFKKTIKYVFKLDDGHCGGSFIIFQDSTAIYLTSGSGYRYLGCNMGTVSEKK